MYSSFSLRIKLFPHIDPCRCRTLTVVHPGVMWRLGQARTCCGLQLQQMCHVSDSRAALVLTAQTLWEGKGPLFCAHNVPAQHSKHTHTACVARTQLRNAVVDGQRLCKRDCVLSSISTFKMNGARVQGQWFCSISHPILLMHLWVQHKSLYV